MCEKNKIKQPTEAKERGYHFHHPNDYLFMSDKEKDEYLTIVLNPLPLSDNTLAAMDTYFTPRLTIRELPDDVVLKRCKHCLGVIEMSREEDSYWYWIKELMERHNASKWKFNPIRGSYSVGDMSWGGFLYETTKESRLKGINKLKNVIDKI